MAHRIVSQPQAHQASQAPPAAPAGGAALGWRTQQLPDDIGACRTDRFLGLPGLALTFTRYRPARDLFEESDQRGQGRVLTLTVALEGASGYRSRDGGTLAFRRGCTTVAASHGTLGDRCFGAGTAVSQLRLAVQEGELTRYLGAERSHALLGARSLQQLSRRPTSAACATHAQALVRQARSAQPDGLAVHLHMLGLLSEELQRFGPERAGPVPRFSEAEFARIERARERMAELLDRPLSVAFLAQEVGLSALRLRRGFQLRYGTSPQRVLLGLRMQHAKTLLEGGCQVAVAAYRTGYAHPANFSAAFSRYFGRVPKSVFGAKP